MKKYQCVGYLCVISLGVLCPSGVRSQTPAAAKKPNIVFILADDLGYGDLGCYGQSLIRTPRIDRMASEGMEFSQCYAGCTVCAPSRCALMTGMDTGHCTIRGNAAVPLRTQDRTVAELLKSAGYATGLVGKWGLGGTNSTGAPNKKGFDYFYGFLNQGLAHNYYPDFLWRNREKVMIPANVQSSIHNVAEKRVEYAPDLFQKEALTFIEQHKDGPFFLYYATTIPHANDERTKVDGNGNEVPDLDGYADRDWPAPEKSMAAMITRLDTDVGKMITKLKDLKIDDNTIIFFTGDNGPHKEGGNNPRFFNSTGGLRGIKRDLYEGGIREPMIVRWPGHVRAGSLSDLQWAFWDFLPTCADLAGVPAPEGIDGISVVPTLLDKGEQKTHPYLYWEFHEGGSKQAVRFGNWKAVRLKPAAKIELYDLRADVGEQQNVANDHPDLVAKAAAMLAGARTESEALAAPAGPGSEATLMEWPMCRALFLSLIAMIGGCVAVLSAAAPVPPRIVPLSPEQARASFKVASGLRVELVAREPQIESPVAMAFDEDGRMFVVEMLDYPNGPAPGQPPEGRIKVLEDRDGDGRYETSHVFADKLLYGNGVLPWKGGAIVTCAPNILRFDGDGARSVLYQGFSTQNPQLRVSYPTLGPDGWVYVANGLRGGQVRRGDNKNSPPINLGGMDFRFDPIHGLQEAISGMGQYGLTFDDWGRRFVCDNHHHIRHVVLPNRYLQRNPYLAVPAVLEDTSELEASVPGAGAKVYPISKNWTTSNLHAGRFTAACGVFVYRGMLLPDPFRGAVFTCEPTGNLIHAETQTPNGASFRSRPLEEGIEFLATPDDWCRPVFITSGPDGAMYVVDMVRAVIEHPEWMPEELKKRPDLLWGKHYGRIWRIVPENYKGNPPRPHLSTATTPELVKLLAHPDDWWRTTAQRLLLERQDPAATEPLRETLRSPSPQARLLAAWLLENRGELHEAECLKLLHDPQPRLREQAVLLSERWLPSSSVTQLSVAELARDPDAQVRFQVALSLGYWNDDRAIGPLAEIAVAGAEDHWTRTAVASAVPSRAGFLLAELLTRQPWAPGLFSLQHDLAAVVGARQDPSEIARVLKSLRALNGLTAVPMELTVLGGLADGTGRRGKHLAAVLAGLPAEYRPLTTWAAGVFAQAAAIATDPHRQPAERLAAVHLLAHAPWEIAGPVLSTMLAHESDQSIRLAVVGALAAQPGSASAEALLRPWSSLSPAIRREAVSALIRQPDRALQLLGAIETGAVAPTDLDPARSQQLLKNSRADIRELAAKVLKGHLPEERKLVLDRYKAAADGEGDAARGKLVFNKNCATCHHVAGQGVQVGPDISDTREKTRAQLLNDILNPNAAIDANYIEYSVSLKNGRSVNGIIVTDTGASITLKRAQNVVETVLRQDVDEVQSTGRSLMPEGLEKTVSVAEMTDLLSFLKNWRYLDGSVPLGSGK